MNAAPYAGFGSGSGPYLKWYLKADPESNLGHNEAHRQIHRHIHAWVLVPVRNRVLIHIEAPVDILTYLNITSAVILAPVRSQSQGQAPVQVLVPVLLSVLVPVLVQAGPSPGPGPGAGTSPAPSPQAGPCPGPCPGPGLGPGSVPVLVRVPVPVPTAVFFIISPIKIILYVGVFLARSQAPQQRQRPGPRLACRKCGNMRGPVIQNVTNMEDNT